MVNTCIHFNYIWFKGIDVPSIKGYDYSLKYCGDKRYISFEFPQLQTLMELAQYGHFTEN